MDFHDKARDNICVALDVKTPEEARKISGAVSEHVGWAKIGKEFFTAHGPKGVEVIKREDLKLFLDLKYHDIPNTMRAVASAASIGADMVNVHASGGFDMMRAANHQRNLTNPDMKVIGVTILTSTDLARYIHTNLNLFMAMQKFTYPSQVTQNDALQGLIDFPYEEMFEAENVIGLPGVDYNGEKIEGYKRRFKELISLSGLQGLIDDEKLGAVPHLAELTKNAGLDGIVCAAPDLAAVRKRINVGNFSYTTPAIGMPDGGNIRADQQRKATPYEALEMGSSLLVIGGAITNPKGMRMDKAASIINEDIQRFYRDNAGDL